MMSVFKKGSALELCRMMEDTPGCFYCGNEAEEEANVRVLIRLQDDETFERSFEVGLCEAHNEFVVESGSDFGYYSISIQGGDEA